MESKDCTEKSLIASEASHDYILRGQKFKKWQEMIEMSTTYQLLGPRSDMLAVKYAQNGHFKKT